MLQFADKEVLTEEGREYLLYDIANTFGFDKEVWIKRTIEARKLVNDIFLDMRSYERKLREYCLEADEPMLFRKAINAWRVGVHLGEPIGHNMGFDATSSGLQIMSAMAGCITGGRNSNILPYKVRKMSEEAVNKIANLEEELRHLA